MEVSAVELMWHKLEKKIIFIGDKNYADQSVVVVCQVFSYLVLSLSQQMLHSIKGLN